MATATRGSISTQLLQELVLLRIRLSALRITSVTDSLLAAIGAIIDSRETEQEFNLEVVERLASTARAWLGQYERVPHIFITGEFFSCARSEDGALFLKFSSEKLPDLLEILQQLQLRADVLQDLAVAPDTRPSELASALALAMRSCLIKNGELVASE